MLKDLSFSDSIDAMFTTKIYDCFMTNNNIVMILGFCPEVKEKVEADKKKNDFRIIYSIAIYWVYFLVIVPFSKAKEAH